MKNKIIIVLIAVVMVVCSLTLVACSNKDADIITNYIFEQEGQIVESDFVLPLTISEKKAEWTSNSQYVTLTKREENWLASVSYPEKDIEDVTLTLTIGSASKDFVVRVKAIDEITFMDNYVFKQDKGTVAANFALDRTYEFKGKTCNISWSVDQAYELYIKISDDGNQCLVFEQSESTPVVIKATFEYQGNTATKSYSMNVYQQLEGLELVDFWYSNTGVSIEMSGYVVLIGTEYSSSYNNVTLYMVNDDYTAGYYLYRVKTTDEHAANLKKGAHVTVTGTTNTNYNGLIETNAGGNLVVDAAWEIPFEEDKAIKVVDDLVIGNLPATIYNESRLVSLTNWKVKSHGAESDLSSDNLTLMTITKGGVSVDIRISKYLEGAYTKGDDTHKALLALLDAYPVDSTLNVQGIFSNYGGAWQIMPLSVDDVTAGGVADADDKKDYDGLKVADAVKAVNAKIAELGLNQRITSNLECELLSSSNGVNISYYIRKSNSAVLDGAKLTVTPGNPETTALQVKYSINDFETVQYIYISSLIPTAASMIEEIKLPDSIIGEVDLPTIEGAEIVWEILTGDTNSLTIDAENNKLVPVLGDKAITYIISAKLTYNGQERTKKFVIVLKSLSDLADHAGTEADPYTIADVNKMFDAEYTDAKNFYLDAYIVEVSGWSDQYGNYSYAKLAASADDDNKVSVYIFKGDDIANAKVGDHVICTVEYISKYNENWQICKVAIVKYVEDGSEVNPDQPADVTVSFTMESIAKANNWENSELYESFEKDGISFKATGTPLGTFALNTGKYYTKGLNWRIYQNENPSLTITAPEGKKIVSVAINYAVKNTGVLLNGETQVASDEVVSVNAKSIVFGVGATDSSKTNGQVQVVSVIVVLGEIDGTEIEVPVHTHTYGDLVPAKDPTCGEAGNVAYYHCEECNKYFDEEKEEIESVEIAPTYYHFDENEDGMCDECNYQFHELGGAYINIAIQSKYLTSETYEYTNSKGSTKLEIVVSENAEDAAIFWVYDNGDGTLSLIATDLETYDMSYLYCNGNDVKYVSLLDMDDNDIYNRFVLEEVEGGYNIKTSAVSYSKVQYLEIYEGYVTCYGLGSDASAFTFSITELNLGGDDDEGDDQDQNSIKYANDDVTITIKSDDEYSLTVDYSAENGNLWAEEYDLSLDETDDGYSFACGVGNAKRDVILVISDDEKTLTLTDSYLNLTNVELTLNYTPSKEDDDQGEAATFTADQQGTYNIVGGSVYGDAVVMIFEESVSVTWTQQGVDVKNAKASLLENGYKVILDAQYGDYLQFSFEGNEMKYYITYNYSTLQGNVSKSTSTEVEE